MLIPAGPRRLVVALLATVGLSTSMAARFTTTHEALMSYTGTIERAEIPASIRAEHEEIHAALERATREPGPVGEAASSLAKVLHAHFVREEEIALPPLGLLAPLARGEFDRGMLDVLPMTDSLRTELPRMLEEHVTIRAATARLDQVARAQGNLVVVRLAEKLALHARSEEEILYPAAVLVGDLVRARAAGGRAS